MSSVIRLICTVCSIYDIHTFFENNVELNVNHSYFNLGRNKQSQGGGEATQHEMQQSKQRPNKKKTCFLILLSQWFCPESPQHLHTTYVRLISSHSLLLLCTVTLPVCQADLNYDKEEQGHPLLFCTSAHPQAVAEMQTAMVKQCLFFFLKNN